MMKKNNNKSKQNEFLQLNVDEKIKYLNDVVKNKGTSEIDKKCDFSYSWVSDKLAKEGIFYVSKIKSFIIVNDSTCKTKIENDSQLTNEEIKFIKKLYKEKTLEKNDIRMVVGICKNSINKSIPIDEKINSMWNDFTQDLNGISAKDLYSSALLQFIEKYKE